VKEIRALVAVLTVFFVVVVAAAVVVLFVPPPVVAAPIGDCGSKSWIFFFIRKATQYCYQLRRVQDFPVERSRGILPRQTFIIEVLRNGIFGIQRPSKRVIMSNFF